MRLSSPVRWFAVVLGLLAAATSRAQADAPPPILVIVSIDGLRPDYVTAAEAHGAKIPELRRFLREGSYAEGVRGVIPTVTYPSHTTILTGVSPAKHGIWSNVIFDPLRTNGQGWYWYSEGIRVPTLWDVAKRAGRVTASIQWPVSVGATSIAWNIPEFWRPGSTDDPPLLRALSTPGLLAEAASAIGPFRGGIDATPDADSVRGRYAEWLIERKRASLLTLHLISLDDVQHEKGPFTPEAIATLERLDAVIGRIRATAERAAPGRAYVAIVSDHGFVPFETRLNLVAAFKAAGLFTVDGQGKITDWSAMPWTAGGSAAIVLKTPGDSATRARVRTLIDSIAADTAAGVDRVLDRAGLDGFGGFPPAALWVSLKSGWTMGSSLDGPVLTQGLHGGTHGASPELPELRASFFVVGPRVPAGKNLGLIDLRDVGPTLAARVGLELPNAEGHDVLAPAGR